MKEKFDFVYNQAKVALEELRKGKNVEQAKATASLLKQANNVLSIQLDASKFMANIKESHVFLVQSGLLEEE